MAYEDRKDRLIETLLSRPLPQTEEPTADRYTLEVNVYWRDDFFTNTDAGRKRRLVVDGYKPFWKADLHVELPDRLSRFVFARIDGREAELTIPEGARYGVRLPSGEIVYERELKPCRAPFAAQVCRIAFFERIAIQVEPLTFVAQFVRFDRGVRRDWDWLVPRFLERWII